MRKTSNIDVRIEKIFDDFIENGSENEPSDEMLKAFHEAVFTAFLEKYGQTNNSEEQKNLLREKMNQVMASMDLNSPSLAHPEKILRSIGISNYKKAAEYLNRLFQYRIKAFSLAQAKKAKKPRENEPFTKLLMQFVKQDPKISTSEVITRLESGSYSNVVSDFDEDNIYYRNTAGQEEMVAKNSIPARLTRLRKRTQ